MSGLEREPHSTAARGLARRDIDANWSRFIRSNAPFHGCVPALTLARTKSRPDLLSSTPGCLKAAGATAGAGASVSNCPASAAAAGASTATAAPAASQIRHFFNAPPPGSSGNAHCIQRQQSDQYQCFKELLRRLARKNIGRHEPLAEVARVTGGNDNPLLSGGNR